MTDANGGAGHDAERVLVVEPEPLIRSVLDQDLSELGYEVVSVASAPGALGALAKGGFSVAVVNGGLGRGGARTVLAAGRTWQPGLQYVILVPFADGAGLDAAMNLHPFACLRVPFSSEELGSVIEVAARHAILSKPAEEFPDMGPSDFAVDSIGPQPAPVSEKV